MKIKIFNLVRVELNNQTMAWSFPTFSQAREKMAEECKREFGVDIKGKDGFFECDDYSVWVGNDYVTICDGNTREFEIIQTTMETYQMQVEAILDMVIKFSGACEKYRELIKDELLCYTEKDLPFYAEEIKHFVDSEFEERLSKRAAAKIVSGYDNDFQNEYFQVAADYLEGNRGLSVMLAIINGEEDAIEDVKREINKEQGKHVFQTDYVWLWESTWFDGLNFEFNKVTKVFNRHDAAYMEMSREQAEVLEVFRGQYIGEDVESYEDKDGLFQVNVKNNDDLWEGRISKIYIQD